MLFAATPAGVYQASTLPFDTAEPVLQEGATRHLHGGPDSGVLAATESGLFHSADSGDSWRDCEVPVSDVYSVAVGEEFLYVGVRPAAIYRSTDGGEMWTELEGFRNASFAASWPTNPHREHAHVRSLATPQADPETLVAGVEVGGLVVSDDGGASWRECQAVPDDVHHVLCLGAERWVVSCGTGGPDGRGGVFQTTDGGETWVQLDTGSRNYVRESCYEGRLYTAANESAPLWSPPDAALFVQREDSRLESVPYPSAPSSFVISWASGEDALLAGTNDGRVLRGRGDDWEQVGTVPVSAENQRAYGVTSLATVQA
jgi:hypothetical protein